MKHAARTIQKVDAPAAPAPTHNLGLLRCDLGFLARLLQIPEGHMIVTAHADVLNGQVVLMIQGPTMPPAYEGHRIAEVRPLCVTAPTDQAVIRVQWPAEVPA